MSSTIPRFVGVRRYVHTGGKKKDTGGIGFDPYARAKSKRRGTFETDCLFRECLMHNHNHLYNLARFDTPSYYFEEEPRPRPKDEDKPKPKPKPKPPPVKEKPKPKPVKEKPKPEPVAERIEIPPTPRKKKKKAKDSDSEGGAPTRKK